MSTTTIHSEIYTIARCLKELIVNEDITLALNNIMEWLAESLHIDRCYISETADYTSHSGRLTSVYSGNSGLNDSSLKNLLDLVFDSDNFPEIKSLLKAKQSFKVSDNDNVSPAFLDFLEVCGLRSLLLIPVHTGNRNWGFIGLGDSLEPRTWCNSENDLRSLASAICVALENNRVKKEIQEQNEQLNSTLQKLKEFIWEIDLVNHQVKTAGDSFLFSHALANKGIAGFTRWLLQHIHPDDLERVRSKFSWFLLQSEQTVDEEVLRIKNKSGQYAWIHAHHRLVTDSEGRCISVAGTVTDITDRKILSLEAEKQKEQYEFLVQSLGQAIFNLDHLGNITFITTAWYNLLGYSPKECLGNNLIQYIPEQEISQFWEHFGNLLANSHSTFDREMQLAHKNGQVIWVRIIAKNVKDEYGQVTGIFGCIENINDKHTAELLLKESNDKLTTILNNSREIILTIDLESNLIESVNDAISILGYQPDEWIGQKYYTWGDDQRKKFHDLMKLAVKSQLQVANQQITFANKSNTALVTFEFSTSIFYFKKSKYLLCVLRDISERVQYEQNISRISEQLQHLINNIDDVYAIYDLPSQQFDFVSNNVEILYGCSRQEFCANGLVWNDIIHLEDLPGVLKTVENVVSSATKSELFYRITDHNGDSKMLLEKITVGKNATGLPEKLYIVKTDYTHIENIERSFIESERKFRFISENISDFISIHDPDWNFNYASPSVRNILGYEPEDMIGRGGFDLVHPDDIVKTLDELLEPLVLQHKEIQLRYRLRASDGNYKWVETYSKPVVDAKGETTSILSSTRDVTDQVNAENRLKTSEEQYRLLSENSNDLIVTYDLAGHFTYVSPSCQQALGYSPSELMGISSTNMLAKDEANAAVVSNSMKKIISDKEPFTFSYTAVTKSGEEKRLEVVVQPILKNGEMVAFQTAARDVTEREELLLELEQALAKERELNELRSMFVATASHQFRTPLTVIQSGVEIMEMYLEDLPENKQQRFHKQFVKIQGEVERLEYLMSDILLLGRANAARTPFNPETGDLISFVKVILEDKYNTRYPIGRQVQLTVRGEPVDFDFDKKLIGHAIENIVTNAYKYSDEGNLAVELNYSKTQVKINISDKGMGIPPEDLKNLFQPFYRATNTNDIEGTGLGLAIVKEFVEKHKGKIFISSELNKGTTVSVILPLKQNLL